MVPREHKNNAYTKFVGQMKSIMVYICNKNKNNNNKSSAR